jgi:hypothetical protein
MLTHTFGYCLVDTSNAFALALAAAPAMSLYFDCASPLTALHLSRADAHTALTRLMRHCLIANVSIDRVRRESEALNAICIHDVALHELTPHRFSTPYEPPIR